MGEKTLKVRWRVLGGGEVKRKLGDQAKLARRRRCHASPPFPQASWEHKQPLSSPEVLASVPPRGGEALARLTCVLCQALQGLHHRLFWPGGLRLQREKGKRGP